MKEVKKIDPSFYFRNFSEKMINPLIEHYGEDLTEREKEVLKAELKLKIEIILKEFFVKKNII